MKQLSYNTGMIALMTTFTILGVPVKGSSLDEMDSLLSILQVFEMLIHLSCLKWTKKIDFHDKRQDCERPYPFK